MTGKQVIKNNKVKVQQIARTQANFVTYILNLMTLLFKLPTISKPKLICKSFSLDYFKLLGMISLEQKEWWPTTGPFYQWGLLMYPVSADKCAGNTLVHVTRAQQQGCYHNPSCYRLYHVAQLQLYKSITIDVSTHTVYKKDRSFSIHNSIQQDIHYTFKALDASCILVLTVSISINIFIDWAVFSSTLKVTVN